MEPEVTTPSTMGEVNITLKFLQRDIQKVASEHGEQLRKISEKLDNMSTSYVNVQEHVHFKDFVEKTYVTREELNPIKKLVYGAVAIILAAVLGAIITLVVIK